MVLKLLFFPKNNEKSSSGWGLRPKTPVCDKFELQYTSLLKHVSQFTHFRILTRLLVSALSLNEFLVTCQHQATTSGLPFYNIFAPPKIPLLKFLMTLLHVICGLVPPPQSKILATPMTQVVVFPLVFFSTAFSNWQ